MPGEPLLCMELVRDWVGDFEIGKGRPYADTAVFGCRCEAWKGELAAFVRGTRPRPYRVSVKIDVSQTDHRTSTIVAASCSCPVGAEGKCKHVAAVMLAYLQDAARFTDVQQAEANLSSRSPQELVALVGCLLNFAPELKPLLAVPLPGFLGETPPAELFRAIATDVVQGTRDHDDFAEKEVVDDLGAIWELHQGYVANAQQARAKALVEGVTQSLRDSGLDRTRFRDALKHIAGCEAIRELLKVKPEQGPQEAPF